jgi:predicted nucleic acid-binding protein
MCNPITTTITQADLLNGIEILPAGKRRPGLVAAVERILSDEFDGRILPFDENAASAFALLVASRDRVGRPISQLDAMIAAIARSRRCAVATRNTAGFEHCRTRVVNPWE